MPRPPSAPRRKPLRLRLVSLEDRTVPAFGPDGPEFRVNGATAGAQHLPDVDLNAAGDLVAVWAGFNPDTGGTDVYARRYTPAGQPAGGEFVVNAFTAGTQAEPRVAVDPAGNFVVAWSGAGADDDNGVFARAFRADGTPLGPDFWANTGGAGGFQTSPDVALAADGRFVVVWYGFVPGDNSGFGIGAQRYALVNGAVTPVGENFAANAALTSNEQFAPAVALTDTGNYVVAWQGFAAGTPDTSGYGVYAQRFDFTGPLGGPVWVNKDLADLDQVSPDVDIGPSGAFAVVWQGAAGTGAPDTSGQGVYVQRFDASGGYLGNNTWVNGTFAAGDQLRPRVARDAAGNLFVTWYGSGPDPSLAGVYARRFNPTGNPLGNEFQVNTYTASDQLAPAVALHPTNGDAVVGWGSDGQDGSSFGVYAQRYLTNRQPTTTGLADVLAIEDAPNAVIDLPAHFTDPDGEPAPLTFSATIAGTAGLFASAGVNGSNQLVLDFAPDAAGTAAVTVRAWDGGKGVDASFRVTVLAVNDPPTARADAYSVAEDATLDRPAVQGVLANDADPEGDALTASLFTGPAHGTLTFRADGGFTYTPVTNFNGPDRFTYQVTDVNGADRVAVVDLTVTPTNDNPTAVADAFVVAPGSGANVLNVLANDSGAPDGPETLTVTGFTPPAHGSVQITGGGTAVSYTPGAGFLGSDAFTYTVADGNGGSATASVSISAPRNQSPVADDDTAAVVENGSILIDVLDGDTDADGDPLAIALVGAAGHGSLTVSGGRVRYTPAEHYFGPDSFQYFVSDGHGGLDAGTVSVSVGPSHGFYATGTDAGPAGSVSTVRLYHAGSGKQLLSFLPYAGFNGGVRVAVGDVTGDGRADVVTAPGRGLAGGSRVKVFDGAALLNGTATEVGPGVLPFGAEYTQELSLALGRFNPDVRADLVIGSFAPLGGPDAVVLDATQALTGTAGVLGTVTDPFGPRYKGGVRVAVGDVNGDGTPDVIASQSAAGSKVTAFSGTDFRTVLTTFAAGVALKGGIHVSAGDLDGDGKAEIVTGADSGATLVSVWRDRSATDSRAIKVTFARPFGSAFKGGARVAVGDVDGDGRLDVAVAPGLGKERRLVRFGLDAAALDPLDEVRTADGVSFAGGLFIAAGRV